MNARVREVICLAGVGICLLAAIPSWAFDSEQLREQVGFPSLYFTFSIEPLDEDWIEPRPTDPTAELKRLRGCLRGAPADAPIALEIARMYAHIGRGGASRLALRQSIRLYEQLLAAEPRNPMYLLGYARALRTAKEYRKAISALEKLARAKPDSWQAYSELGRAYSELSRASVEFLAAKPDPSALPGFQPATLDGIEEMTEKARRCYGKAAALAPNMPEPLYLRCVGLIEESDLLSCLADLDKAVWESTEPERSAIYTSALVVWTIRSSIGRLGPGMGGAWEAMTPGDRSSIARYEQRLAKIADSSGSEAWRAREALGLIAAVRGEKEKALTHFRAAYDLNPAAAMAYGALLVDCKERGRVGEAIPLIQRRIRAWDSAGDRLKLSRVYANLGRLDLAEEQCRITVCMNPRDPDANFMMGVLLLKRYSSAEQAVGYLQKALALSVADLDDCRFALGVAYLLLDDREHAIEALKQSDTAEARKLLEELKGDRGCEPGSSPLAPAMGDTIS